MGSIFFILMCNYVCYQVSDEIPYPFPTSMVQPRKIGIG